MGMRIISTSAYDKKPETIYKTEYIKVPTPNPDPCNYKIIRYGEVDKYLIVIIQYPDCTNYEGKKIVNLFF